MPEHAAVLEAQARERLVGEQQVAVEVHPIRERGDGGGGRHPELGLTMQPSITSLRARAA